MSEALSNEMKKYIIHIDFDSYFASCEQQANPRLRGKPIGVSGGDRLTRTVVGAASVEAKRRGVKTGMKIPDALKLCPDLILVKGDSDRYLSVTKKFLNILKGYTDKLEIFSIDEVFLQLSERQTQEWVFPSDAHKLAAFPFQRTSLQDIKSMQLGAFKIAQDIKFQIHSKIGEFITCSVGISYNKMLAKLAGSLYKPNGLVGIFDRESAMNILDRVELDDVCGIGFRTKRKLNNMGVFNFKDLRAVPLVNLLASFKSYGQVLYNFARGEDDRKIIPFFEKEEVKSIGHQHTISKDVSDPEEIKQTLLKICELVGRRARSKKLEGRTISFGFRYGFNLAYFKETGHQFHGEGMQSTIPYTNDGLEIFNAAWKSFYKLWDGSPIRFVAVSLGNVKPTIPQNLSLLEEVNRREVITRALDKINDRYGEFTLQRGILLNSRNIRRLANSFMSDRRFELGI